MNFFVLFFFAYYAVIFLIVAIPFLLLVSWAVNRWLLKRKLKLRYRILLSIGGTIFACGFGFLGYILYSIQHFKYGWHIVTTCT